MPFTVAKRAEGEGKWSVLNLVDLALTAVVSFTAAPLRIVSLLGVVTLILGVVIAGDALWSWFHGNAVSGFATTITTLLILCSFIMISLGIIGEYIAKIYEEIKQRPLYVVESVCGSEDGPRSGACLGASGGSRSSLSTSEGPDAVGRKVPD